MGGEFSIRVYGVPAPQGSKKNVGHGIMVEMSKKVKPWRDAVSWAVIEKRGGDPQRCRATGAVEVNITFFLKAPKKKKTKFPTTRPDVDKLTRSTFDSLTTVGAIEDDSNVVHLSAWKVYEDEVERQGALITVKEMP